MPNEKEPPSGGLTLSQAQVNRILGRSLARLYQDVLQQPLPENLQHLIDQLEERERIDAERQPKNP